MRFALSTAATALAVLAIGGLPAAHAADKITGSGSTFVKPMMDKWITEFGKDHKDLEINYQSVGSSAGVKQMTEGSTTFGCTDAFIKKEDLKAAKGEIIHVPLVMGAVVPAYNVPGVNKPLNFTGEVLAEIFMGKITKWDDKKIADLNPGVNLPDLDISTVHRADGSGTTSVFTTYLAKVDDSWKKEVGFGNKVDWKGGTAEPGNEGCAGAVEKSKGAISYLELAYVLQKKMQYGAVKNKEGEFVLASPEGVQKAAEGHLKDKAFPADLRFNLVDAPGAGAYPISGTTWAVVYADQKGENAKALTEFFSWVLTDGQKYPADMGYAPLPEGLAKLAKEKLDSIKAK